MRACSGPARNSKPKRICACAARGSIRSSSGTFTCLSGDLLFHGNRYRVARGDINFANPFRLDPVVNVEASTTIQQYEITLNFNGPASKLTLAYRSDPPLPAQDIVTLLALGQTSSEGTSRSAGNSQSTDGGATALLSEAVSSQVGGRLEKLFGITNFRVDPGAGRRWVRPARGRTRRRASPCSSK